MDHKKGEIYVNQKYNCALEILEGDFRGFKKLC